MTPEAVVLRQTTFILKYKHGCVGGGKFGLYRLSPFIMQELHFLASYVHLVFKKSLRSAPWRIVLAGAQTCYRGENVDAT